MSDPQIPAELLAEYVAHLRAVRDELGTLLTSPEGKVRLLRLAHQLRGSGGAYGFPGITEHAARVEESAPERLAEETRALIAHLTEVAAPLPARTRILLVDDDPDINLLLGTILRAADRELVVATTAAEADQALAAGRFELILLDLFLADEDGRRLLERWRAAPATRDTPLFVLSAQLGPEVKAECFALGADSYFEKPFEPAVVTAAVASALQRRGSQAVPVPARLTQSFNSPVAGRPASILLADDDPLIANIVRHRLQKAGHRVTHAGDGAAALRAIETDRPDLMILDVKMPELDGHAVLRQLRADPANRGLPVILLTALGEEEDVVRGFSLGADDYLAKPFSPAELAVRVDRLLRRA